MGLDARGVAVDALLRIEDGAYANLVLPGVLDRSGLAGPDRRLATDLVYGATRMRRACDWLADRFLVRDPDPPTRAALRVGAYQLAFLRTPPHAAVSTAVAVAPKRTRGLVNAVLRRVAAAGEPSWPSDAVRLSYPDWILERLTADLGADLALGALAAMNQPAAVTTREDGYVQDPASQWVAASVGARPGDRIADLCAAPGGKATALDGAVVVAADIREGRARLIAGNAARLGNRRVAPLVADGTSPPLRAGVFDRVLVDAPCSGLGVLRRRPDARWRVRPSDVEDLVSLQRRLLSAAAGLVRPGGVVVYSVCTLTASETVGVDAWLAGSHPELVALPAPGEAPAGEVGEAPAAGAGRGALVAQAAGRGALLLPQAAGTDGMFLLLLRRTG